MQKMFSWFQVKSAKEFYSENSNFCPDSLFSLLFYPWVTCFKYYMA